MDSAVADKRIKSAFPNGSFSTGTSQDRLNHAKLSALQHIYSVHDWDFKIKLDTINTTAGNLGPYVGATDLIRFANIIRNYKWGTDETDRIVPIRADSGTPYELYFYIKNGSLYFREDPGTQTLDLYYRGSFNNDPDALDSTEALVDPDLMSAYIDLTLFHLKRMMPGQSNDAMMHKQMSDESIELYWQDYSKDLYPKKMNPRDVYGVPLDGFAEQEQIFHTNKPFDNLRYD